MNLFVASSASDDIPKLYLDDAKKIAKYLSCTNINIVNGCSDKGIMGIFYNTFNKDNIISYNIKEYINELEGNITTVNDILDRTRNILKISDIYLFLAGGIGTMQELFSALDMVKTYNISKKIIIYNYNGFYNKIIEVLKDMKDSNFLDKSIIDNITIVNNNKDLINILEEIINGKVNNG